MEKVRGKAGIDGAAGWNLIGSLAWTAAVFPDRQVKGCGLMDKSRIPAIFLVAAEHVAVRAAGGNAGAPMPQIPGDILRSPKIQSLQIFLFLLIILQKYGKLLIEYQILLGGEPIKGEYLLDKTEINDHCFLVSALGTTVEKKNNRNSDEMISYLKFSRCIKKFAQRTVDIAFPIRLDKDGTYQCIKAPSPYVSVYFPTETESKLDFIVQGPYRTTPNRSSIPSEDEDNILLAEETAILLREIILELKEAGKFNMSFVKALPISEEKFDSFDLFLPLYETVRDLFRSVAVIPSKSGKYVFAKYAKISRQERLANVFTDSLLTQLINDGHKYYWLPTFLTETNREYKPVLDYMISELDITVIRPEDLRTYIASNPKFLPEQTNRYDQMSLVEYIDPFTGEPVKKNKR